MKILKTLIATLILISITVNSFSQVNLDSALIGYYPFNGNANDESFNSYDGNVNGASLTTDRAGNPNSAYHFDGDNDYITTAANIYGGYKGSIAAWIYIDSLTERLPIFSQGDFYSDYNSLRLTVWNDSLAFVVDHRDCGNSDDYPTIKAKMQIPESQWIFVVVTSDSLVHKLYINSVLYDYRTIIPAQGEWFGNLCNQTRDTYIGAWFRPSNDEYFVGKLDDIRIYDREINQSEVTALFNEIPVGVKFIESDCSFKIYPNPAKDYIKIKGNSEIRSLEIYNINGEKLLEGKPRNSELTVNITSLLKGIYFVKIKTDNGITTQKFIK